MLPQSLFFSEPTTFEMLSKLDANLGNNTQVLDDPPSLRIFVTVQIDLLDCAQISLNYMMLHLRSEEIK